MKSSKAQIHGKFHRIPTGRFDDRKLISFGGVVVFVALIRLLGLKKKLHACFSQIKSSGAFGCSCRLAFATLACRTSWPQHHSAATAPKGTAQTAAATKAKSSTIPPELYTLSKQFLRRDGTPQRRDGQRQPRSSLQPDMRERPQKQCPCGTLHIALPIPASGGTSCNGWERSLRRPSPIWRRRAAALWSGSGIGSRLRPSPR